MNVLITGASQGIGYEISKYFLRAGGNRIGVIARNQAGLQQLTQEVDLSDGEIIPYVFDLKKFSDQPHKLIKLIHQDFDQLDILINNAGLLIVKPFSELLAEDYLQSYVMNFLVPALLIRELFSLFSGSSVRHIVNISSMGGYQGSKKFPGLAAYSASKAALANLTESLAIELKDTDIHVNCLALGAVQTTMLSHAFPGYKAPVEPEEMGEFIYRFALSAGKVMNGKVIPVSLSTP